MSLIKGAIPPEAFEVVRDRIGQILADELMTQYLLTYDADLVKVPVFKERHIAGAPVELSYLNVMLEHGAYDNQHQGQTQGRYRFIIECVTGAPFKGDTARGDTRSFIKNQKILGLCRAILENPVYVTLGFPAPFLSGRWVEELIMAPRGIPQDAVSVAEGRIILIVEVREIEALLDANLIKGNDTTVKLYETNQGFVWTFDQPSPGTFDIYFDRSFPGGTP